jgi:hypothetical protein
MDIKLSALLRAVVPVVAAAAVVGGLPTWKLLGMTGIYSELVAVCGVVVVMVLNGKLTVLAAKRSARDACIVFLGGSVARVLACPLVVFVAGWLLNLPVVPLSVWLAITYLLCLVVECFWIVVALKRHVKTCKPQKTQMNATPKYMDWSI